MVWNTPLLIPPLCAGNVSSERETQVMVRMGMHELDTFSSRPSEIERRLERQ